ncbi:MAG TPA: TIGR02680 family protein, partial [Tepidisphaeraceae bacterium]|nr:TIGR02680 family protein [Tepidisphaeraceae bacterium]
MMFDNDQPTLRNGKSPTIDLPQADSSRWQPLRSGLLNIYRYDNQEFHFERGHLLLRGNNGTGKSRVLALQLPFLFDADVSPHRVEPDGDSAKRIEWNLLMGKHPQRLGYTWLEFGRKDANGTCHYLTLGIGLNAIEGRGAPTRWHFITRQRISRDLLLHNERDEPLTHERLIEAIGMHGNVYETAREYRRAVDMELFKLGEHRYRSLIDLLIQLRQPQLARDLDDKRMSAALSEALSPVDGRIIADVAESFRSLEKDQHELRRAESASEAVDGFLSVYGPYTKIAARRRADVVRAKHADYESAMRRLRDAEAERKEGARQLGAIETQIKQLDADEQTAIATADALANSPQMRDARELEAARQTARERAADAERQRTDCNEANQQRQSFNDEHTQAHVRAKQTWREVEAALAESKQRASNADLTDAHHQAIDPLGLDNVTDIGPMKTSAASLQNTIEKRRVAIHHLNQLNIAVDQAERELTAARQAQIEREGELTEAIESQRAAHVAAEQQASALLNAVRTWRNNLIELKSDVSETLDESLETWCETGEGRSPLAVAIELASDAARQRLTITRAEYEQSLRELNEELTGLRQRRQALLDGKHEPPPRPHTRSDNARRDQRGAAFWSLVDFAPSLNAEQQANIEAALESAGLLDAWVTSDGLLIDGETHDTLLDPRDLPLAPDDRRLCRWLIPDEVASTVDRSINSEIIQSILMVIGAGIDSGSVWINDDGSWRNGPLHGRWSKPLAQHIGQSARQRNREQQIAHLNELIDVNDHAQELTQKSINVIVQRLINVTAEVCSAPTDEGVRQALAHVGATAGLVVRARSRVVDAELIVRSRLEVTNRTVEKRDQDASDFGLQNWVKRLLEL